MVRLPALNESCGDIQVWEMRPADADHVGAEGGEIGADLRAGNDAGQLDDADPRQGRLSVGSSGGN